MIEKLFAVGCQFNGEPYVGIVTAASPGAAAELAVRHAHGGLTITWVASVGIEARKVISAEGLAGFAGNRMTKVSVETVPPPPPPAPTTVVRLNGWIRG